MQATWTNTCLWSHFCVHTHTSCRKETRVILLGGMFRAVNMAFFYVFTGMMNLLMFSTFTLATGNSLTPSIVFTTFALTQSLRGPAIMLMVSGILGLQEAKVAFTRIQVSLKTFLFCGSFCNSIRLQSIHLLYVCCYIRRLCRRSVHG